MKILKAVSTLFKGKEARKRSDFSDFFTKSSGDKKKVISQVLREANEEQRRTVDEYRKQLNGA